MEWNMVLKQLQIKHTKISYQWEYMIKLMTKLFVLGMNNKNEW